MAYVLLHIMNSLTYTKEGGSTRRMEKEYDKNKMGNYVDHIRKTQRHRHNLTKRLCVCRPEM